MFNVFFPYWANNDLPPPPPPPDVYAVLFWRNFGKKRVISSLF